MSEVSDVTEQAAATLPPAPAQIHFVGVGGIGMSGLARILRAWGYRVTGSDSAASPLTAVLAGEGIAVTIGHTATDRAAEADLVVVTAAVAETNPELVAAHAAGRRIVKRAELLGALMNARDGIAVAGSHGKSTTSGMLAAALLALNAEPSYAIGAVLAATGTNAAPGAGRFFVVEADEYDRSFLHLAPRLAIVTNIDYDHPDIFPDRAAYEAAFASFVAGIHPDGALVLAADDPGCQRLLAREDLRLPARLITFGEAAGADWTLARGSDNWVITAPDGQVIPLVLAAPGRHNARNATAALAALDALGFARDRAVAALMAFAGIGRRFEGKGEAAGVVVIDDYAHHPTEIRATLAAARERFPRRRLWAVFQPHTYSRLKALLPEFGAAFADADRVGILDVYAARERDTLGVGSDDLRALVSGSLDLRDPAEAAKRLAALVESGDVVLTL
ncbi:MAG: UDP-N-acetylmuramate--L-alanine ligase, partial [Thermomicrobiales bacterium]|nr:UDP-N-acetylmuramate--L-alanine ligase [Thermomicrobiales bacterium]